VSARMPRRARLSAVVLLLVWVGPVTFEQSGSWPMLKLAGAPAPASAEPWTVSAGQAMLLEPGTPLKLKLRDGSIVRGRFLGRTLLDSAAYAPRFDAYLRFSTYVPFAMGESLIVSLRDGSERVAPFAGYGELTLLLRSPDGEYLRVPFEFASEIRRAKGGRIGPKALIEAFHDGLLPSAEALVLGERVPIAGFEDEWAGALRVPMEDIKTASPESPSGRGGDAPAGAIVLGVVATLAIICLLAAKSEKQTYSGCAGPTPTFWEAGQLTPQAFDLYRGCFVGDALAVADPWPGQPEPVLANAPAAPAASRAMEATSTKSQRACEPEVSR
jgi:hypothetical protein